MFLAEAGRGQEQNANMPPRQATPKMQRRAAELRHNLTPAERKLWGALRNDQLGVSFRRQHAIGNYIVDFCSPRQKLIIELDGGQHLEQQEYDQVRTEFLQAKGYRVLRFWNKDVLSDLNGVMKAILDTVPPVSEL
jgi:very-short-patch-repair endonuclease